MASKVIHLKRNVGDIWLELEGSKRRWKLQFPKGVLQFRTKKQAEKVRDTFNLT